MERNRLDALIAINSVFPDARIIILTSYAGDVQIIPALKAASMRCGLRRLLLDAAGKERVRLEGYLPNNDFMAALKNGLGRIAFVQKKYADAERWYGDVVAQYGDSHFAPEAMYWRAVAQYSASHDHTVLGKVAEELRSKYPSSVWASKAIPWLH